jgi:anhydro-N-acetylmuramic acid kinase
LVSRENRDVSVLRAIGLMSGTSLDGVDVALIETDGERRTVLGATGYRPYADEERALLRQALVEGVRLADRLARPGVLAQAEALITRAHAEAVERFMAENGLSAGDVDVVGFHGQTVLHRPERALTVQIGDGPALAARLRIPVVHDLRAADVAAGGQGAPLVPVFHRALAEAGGLEPPLAVLNIGGVANVTLIGPDGELLAFDTGPGNALLDDWVRERTGADYDADGAIAAAGRPDEALLAWLLTHPYFVRRPPKSLDRNWFSHRIVAHLSTEDGAATLAAFTARSIARALDFVGARPPRWIVGGGGAENGEILRLLGAQTGAEVVKADLVGWSAAALEAQAFGFLAVRSLKGLPITYPSTTGAPQAMTGGVLAQP